MVFEACDFAADGHEDVVRRRGVRGGRCDVGYLDEFELGRLAAGVAAYSSKIVITLLHVVQGGVRGAYEDPRGVIGGERTPLNDSICRRWDGDESDLCELIIIIFSVHDQPNGRSCERAASKRTRWRR